MGGGTSGAAGDRPPLAAAGSTVAMLRAKLLCESRGDGGRAVRKHDHYLVTTFGVGISVTLHGSRDQPLKLRKHRSVDHTLGVNCIQRLEVIDIGVQDDGTEQAIVLLDIVEDVPGRIEDCKLLVLCTLERSCAWLGYGSLTIGGSKP